MRGGVKKTTNIFSGEPRRRTFSARRYEMSNGRRRKRSRKQKQKQKQRRGSGPTLPTELWAEVFSFCDPEKDWPAVSRVCKRWYNAGKTILDVFSDDTKTIAWVSRHGYPIAIALNTPCDDRSDDDWGAIAWAIERGRGYLLDRRFTFIPLDWLFWPDESLKAKHLRKLYFDD